MSGIASTPDPDRVEVLYERARRLPPPMREELLSRTRASEPQLAEEVASLLRAGDEAGGFFKSLGKTLFSGEDGAEDPGDLIPKIDPMYGTRVGPYRIDTVIGRGGMGIVYRAVHTELDQTHALKFLPALAASSAEVRKRFIAEASVTVDVRHPNVGEVFEISETPDGRLYLAMPFYPGESLKRRLRGGALPIEETLDWLRQTAAGLQAVHAAGITHRDLTPGNLLRDGDGTVKILDFGLAKVADVTMGTGNRPLGTVAYMAPEQLAGKKVDHRADLWSLGVILYEMLWGRRPFGGKTMRALMAQVRNPGDVEFPELPEGADPRLDGLVRGLMAPAPADRPEPDELIGI